MRTSFTSIFCLAALPLALAASQTVVVGGDGVIAFTPNQVTAAVGDTIVFEFHQKNHTVTQSTLASPCSPLANGFDSGFVPVPENQTSQFTHAVFTVKDTNPVWAYCRQANHCQQGMVFAINAGTQFAAFQSAATGGAAASSTASSSTPASSGTTTGASNHVVVVGGAAGLVYTPSTVTAAIGDTITFQFQTKNHTATQSSFGDPCRKLELTSTSGQVGFDSGFMPVAAGDTVFPTFTVTVNDTTPLWVYCKQTSHCGEGMVFAANAPTTGNTFSEFQAQAKQLNGSSSTTTSTGTGYGGTSDAVRTSTFGLGAGLGLALAVAALVL